jgi:protein-L-isoaspartate(D-aspartate) O-methyltransferase
MNLMKPMTEKHLAVFRRHMVEVVDIHFDMASEEIGRRCMGERLRAAMLKIPRHQFVPQQFISIAYQDSPLPIGFDKTISQPFIAAMMMDLLDVRDSDKTLEVGTGYGYQTAVLAELAAAVFSVDIVEEFVEVAQSRMATLGIENVTLRVGDGSRGWSEEAPFDKIIVAAASDTVPQPLLDQLRPRGRLIMPVGSPDVQQITLIEKQADGELNTRTIMPARFSALETV